VSLRIGDSSGVLRLAAAPQKKIWGFLAVKTMKFKFLYSNIEARSKKIYVFPLHVNYGMIS
jgi:hypothetical protein